MNAAEIIKALGGRSTVRKITGCRPNTVLYWELRDRIPLQHWQTLVEHAAGQPNCSVTIDTLLRHVPAKTVAGASSEVAA